jgi:transposase
MKFYCGIDLSARDCHVCVIDQQLKIVVQQKLRNELAKICQLLEPYKAKLKIVVESTFNWYWLIDGLQAEGSLTRGTQAGTVGKLISAGFVPPRGCWRR